MARNTAVLGDTLAIIPYSKLSSEDYIAARILRYTIDDTLFKEYIEVGRSSKYGFQEENQKTVAQAIIDFFDQKGYRVVADPSLPELSNFTPEENTVLNTTFPIEQKETNDEHSGLSETS